MSKNKPGITQEELKEFLKDIDTAMTEVYSYIGRAESSLDEVSSILTLIGERMEETEEERERRQKMEDETERRAREEREYARQRLEHRLEGDRLNRIANKVNFSD